MSSSWPYLGFAVSPYRSPPSPLLHPSRSCHPHCLDQHMSRWSCERPVRHRFLGHLHVCLLLFMLWMPSVTNDTCPWWWSSVWDPPGSRWPSWLYTWSPRYLWSLRSGNRGNQLGIGWSQWSWGPIPPRTPRLLKSCPRLNHPSQSGSWLASGSCPGARTAWWWNTSYSNFWGWTFWLGRVHCFWAFSGKDKRK